MSAVLQPLEPVNDETLIACAFGMAGTVLKALEQRVAAEPERVSAWTSLGIARARAGAFDSALKAFQRAVAIAPGHVLSTAYLGICLHLVGRDDEALELLDHEGMIEVTQLQPGASPAEMAEFNAELAAYLHSHPTLTWQLQGKATRGGFQTGELLTENVPEVMRQFQSMLSARLRRLLSDEENGTPTWGLTAWAVSLTTGGYQEPHVHQAGMVSGVYYVQLPPPAARRDAGALRFPRQLSWLARPQLARTLAPYLVLPRPGMLVVFPSYFWHETVPFESDRKRVSIAFDVLPPAMTEYDPCH